LFAATPERFSRWRETSSAGEPPARHYEDRTDMAIFRLGRIVMAIASPRARDTKWRTVSRQAECALVG
jgi:hypothetical protein